MEEQRLRQAAEEGSIHYLYVAIQADPRALETIDEIPFVDTPLHVAAAAGQTHFAIEILSLKPSFGRKLNPMGLSPLHLALQNAHSDTARQLVKFDSELIRVKGATRSTPLHLVALTDIDIYIDLLVEFLLANPASIEDLTIRGETVVHVALKNRNFRALKILLGWLDRTNQKRVLDWKDENGNTVLHVAALEKQPEVYKRLLYSKVNKKAKNLGGLTAPSIFSRLPSVLKGEDANTTSMKAGCLRSSFPNSTMANFLNSEENYPQKFLKFCLNLEMGISEDVRNVLLVVAVLMVTATYQAALSPPGGLWQDDINSNTTTAGTFSWGIGGLVSSKNKPRVPGKMVMSSFGLHITLFFNSIALAASLGTIFFTVQVNRYTLLLHISLYCLLGSYFWTITSISPTNLGAFLITGPVYLLLLMTVARVLFQNMRGEFKMLRKVVTCRYKSRS